MRSTRTKTVRGLTAVTAILILSVSGAFAQEDKSGQKKAGEKKPQKAETAKKAPKSASNKNKPKEPARKDTHAEAEAKIEVRVHGVGKGDGKKPEVTVKRVPMQTLRRHHAHSEGPELKMRPWLGIAMRPVPDSLREYLDLDEGFGVQVELAVKGSPAAIAGLQAHDILTQLDDQRIISPDHVALLVRSKKKGDKVEVTFIRKGKEQTAEVKLDEKELPPFSNAPVHPGHGAGDRNEGFGFQFGGPGKEGQLRFHGNLPSLNPAHKEELSRFMKNYSGDLKKMLEEAPKTLRFHWDLDQSDSPKNDDDAKPTKPTPEKPGGARSKPIPPLPGKSAGGGGGGKPPAIMVRPGFPLKLFGGAGIVKIDNAEGAVTITANKEGHKITIENKDGETVYEGPFDPKKDLKDLPPEAQKQMKTMKLDDLQLLTPAMPAPVKPKNKKEVL